MPWFSGGVGPHGLVVDSLLSMSVVTADGSLVEISEDVNPDLFWGHERCRTQLENRIVGDLQVAKAADQRRRSDKRRLHLSWPG